MPKLPSSCEGGCTCGHVRYQITSDPLIVHCCHCRYCQRQTGASFALNALFEAKHIKLINGDVNEIEVSSPSDRGQTTARCPKCEVAIWSNYFMGGIKDKIRFIRVGTLDNPDLLPPDVHIYTESKQPWVNLPANALVVEKFYDFETTWTPDNEKLRKSLLAEVGKNNR